MGKEGRGGKCCIRQSGGATVFNREQKLLVVNIIAVSLSDQIFHSHSLL